MTSRRHGFTLFRKNLDGNEFLNQLDKKVITYVVFQTERCPKTGNSHFQGFIIWTTPIRFPQACKRLGGYVRLFKPVGNDQQNEDYCSKEDTRIDGPWRWGLLPSKGQRNDLGGVHKMVQDGAPLREIYDKYFGTCIRYAKGLSVARSIYSTKRDWIMEIDVFWGPTGTGKTVAAWKAAGGGAYALSPPNVRGGSIWWDDYDGESNIIVDEFYAWIPWCNLLLLTDSKPYRIQCKGGSRQFLGKHIWFCSNLDPRHWYKYGERMEWETLRRRITKISHFRDWIGPEEAGADVQ